MSYRLQPSESLGVEVVRVFREQVDRAAHRAANNGIGIRERARAARTACKRVRALLRLVRAQSPKRCRREDTRFRDAARELSALRDATIRLDAFNRLLSEVNQRERRRFALIRRLLEAERRQTLADRANTTERLSHFVYCMQAAAERATNWEIEGGRL